MYEARIWWATECGETFNGYIHLMRTGVGKRSTFAVVARRDGREAVRETEVKNYPIWSEAALGLLARALNSGSFHAAELIHHASLTNWSLPANQVASIDVSVSAVPHGPGAAREIEGLHIGIKQNLIAYEFRRGKLHSGIIEREMSRPPGDACAIALYALCDLVWGTQTVGPLPGPVSVPTRRWGDINYVLLLDIPEQARQEFAGLLEFIDTPDIPCEAPDACAFAKDWEDFHSGKNYYETGFVPGVRFRVQF